MKSKIRTVLISFTAAMFSGIVIISVGLSPAFPVLDRVSAPFVCSEGKMVRESKVYSGMPGQSATTLSWICVDTKTGKQQYVTFKAAAVTGIIYGLILFILFTALLLIPKRKNKPEKKITLTPTNIDTQRLHEKMTELKKLRDDGLISDDEYRTKKEELLKSFIG